MFKNVHFNIVGKFTSRGEWLHPEIVVPTTEIIIMTEGRAYIEEDGKQYTLTPDTVMVLTPELMHRGYKISTERVSFYWLHMDGFDDKGNNDMPKIFTLSEPHNVTILLRQLMHYKSRGADDEVCNSLLRVLLHELMEQSGSADGAESALAARIREWIRINADRSITATDVAEKFGYNVDYISRICKKHYGVPLKSLITELKVGHINKLLLDTDLTLAEIADSTGFGDYKLFLKFFKYHTDMTPSDFRRIYYAIHTNNK